MVLSTASLNSPSLKRRSIIFENKLLSYKNEIKLKIKERAHIIARKQKIIARKQKIKERSPYPANKKLCFQVSVITLQRDIMFYYLPSCTTALLLPSLATLGLASKCSSAKQEIIKHNVPIKGYNSNLKTWPKNQWRNIPLNFSTYFLKTTKVAHICSMKL